MGKLKIKKHDIWIDMTPMSDMMALSLTSFMLTSTFIKNEPMKVSQSSSVSEIKVPENSVLNILANDEGRVFMSMDNQNDLLSLIQGMNETGNLGLTNTEMKKFQTDPMWGVLLNNLKGYLSLPTEKMTEVVTSTEADVPLNSINGGRSGFQHWVTEALNVDEDIKITIKVDAKIPYANMKKVMSELQDINQNRYYLITTLRTGKDE